ncbi:hypothetical protein LCGC14_2038400 [marine sediment metagenome]|uniref:Uncharacterized protein n=1 Tax=marine sediment metagenome TaxID=412755 RepID=A0A0F9FF77_9ZZZZ
MATHRVTIIGHEKLGDYETQSSRIEVRFIDMDAKETPVRIRRTVVMDHTDPRTLQDAILAQIAVQLNHHEEKKRRGAAIDRLFEGMGESVNAVFDVEVDDGGGG